MEEVHDLHQYTHLVFIYIQKTKVSFDYFPTTEKIFTHFNRSIEKNNRITYDKLTTGFLSQGNEYFKSDDRNEDVCTDNFRDELYQIFKAEKEEWDKYDLFLLKSVSDFILLSVELLMKESKGKIESTDRLHYIFVVPSDWEEEIRETLLRPILIQSNLISKNDHNDRLLFCSDLESIFYDLMGRNEFDFEKIRKTILCRLCPVSKNKMLIKLDLVSTINRLFDFPDSLLFPNIECSNQLSLTINTFTDGIRAFMKDKLPLSIQEEIIQLIMYDVKDKDYALKKPLITDTSRWELDNRQLDFIESICIFDICSQICKNMTNNINVLLLNNIIKEYNFLSRLDLFSSGTIPNENLLNWSRYLMTYNRTYSCNENIVYTYYSSDNKTNSYGVVQGAGLYAQDVINNANIYGRPRILPVENLANSSSVFQESKPDAIMNIDMSIESTILSFSLLDKSGCVKEFWDHKDFLNDKSLYSLGSFFSFSETVSLTVKSSFIEFAKNHLMDDGSFLSGDKNNSFLQLNATTIETMLRKDSYTEDLLVSTQQQNYIKAFVLIYMIYIKYIISSKLSDIVDSNMEIKIGYNITVEKILLNCLFSTKEGLKEIIYASGLIQKDDSSKKLRVITEGERILHLIQRSLALPFPLNSYFVLAQLHENYIQLTLNQVVTEISSSEEDQEAIVIHDRIINIPNIYTSLCLNMWNNIVEDNSLIKLCDIHQEYSSDDLLEILSLKNQAEFTKKLNQYISKDNLCNSSSQPATDKINIQLSVSCNCRVYLTIRDIIDVSFRPVLQDIVSLVSASLKNKILFGKFWNIQYLFQSIQFDYNSQLHDSVIKMLKETTEDDIIEQGVDISHYVIPKSLNQLLQPALHQQPISYKEFQVGTLRQVLGDRYGFGFYREDTSVPLVYKSETKKTKTVSVNEETVFPLFKKGDLINGLQKNVKFYLSLQEKTDGIYLGIKYFKLKITSDLNSDGTVRFDDVQENVSGPNFEELYRQNFKKGKDIPFLISVLYEAFTGSLTFKAKLVGRDTYKAVTVGIPTHLSRF